MLPRLLLAFPERDDLRAIREPQQADTVLALDRGQGRGRVAVDEVRPADELRRSLRLRAPELAGHEGDLTERCEAGEPVVDRDEELGDDHAAALRDDDDGQRLPAAHQEFSVLVRRVAAHLSRRLVARPDAVANECPRVAVLPVVGDGFALLKGEPRGGADGERMVGAQHAAGPSACGYLRHAHCAPSTSTWSCAKTSVAAVVGYTLTRTSELAATAMSRQMELMPAADWLVAP